MLLNLSPRLARVAGHVRPGAVPVDVGTDHAHVPIWLLQKGICERAYASDNKPGPLRRAAADAAQSGVGERLTLWLCDGLALCPPAAVDTVILAGMGGETMVHILSEAPWALDRRLILQPQSKIPALRRWLAERSRAVLDAELADDAGRLYLIWLVGPGEMDGAAAVDRPLLEKRDALLRPWLAEGIKRARNSLRGMEQAKSPDGAALSALRAHLEKLEHARRETLTW